MHLPTYLITLTFVYAADIVEKEFDELDFSDASNRPATIPLKADDSSSERFYERDFDLVVSNNLRHRADDRFSSQRENFADLYISRPPNENDDVIYGDVPGGKQRTSVDDRNRFAGDGSTVCGNMVALVSPVYVDIIVLTYMLT